MTPPPLDSSRKKAEKARTLIMVFRGLIENWDKHREDLNEPVDIVVRTTLAAYMAWAESLFDTEDPIQFTIRYLGSVGNYDDPNLLEEKKLRIRNACEYLKMIMDALQSLLNERYAGGRRPEGPVPPEARRYSLVAPSLRGAYDGGRQHWPIRPGL